MMTTRLHMDAPDLKDLPVSELLAMRNAGLEVLTCLAALGRAQASPVAQMLKHGGAFFEEDHYPKGDVYDHPTASQYYYHAHRKVTGEHGHFHTFVRAKGIPPGISPAPYTGSTPPPSGDDAICHLIAVSMNAEGLPVGMFTTNRWVTAESFYSASDAITTLACFEVDHADPCWATNRWLTAMLRLFRPTISALIRARDTTISEWQTNHPNIDVFEDRSLEVTSEIAVDIDKQIDAVEAALSAHNDRRAAE
jgi:hypothetical protein